MAAYAFEGIDRFRDRDVELAAVQRWYLTEGETRALLVHGRRRVGKSWLSRAFAHGREADIFVAATRALGDQLSGFADTLARDAERPDLPDVEAFFRVLYRRARAEPRLAIVDDLPNLVGRSRSAVEPAQDHGRVGDHLASTVEEIAREWVRRCQIGNATRVGSWWGPSLDEYRGSGKRSSEEIDIVGLRGKQATVVGEVRWRSDPMDVGVLGELERFQLPALARAGVRVAQRVIVLVSRSGFTGSLLDAAERERRIVLVDPEMLTWEAA